MFSVIPKTRGLESKFVEAPPPFKMKNASVNRIRDPEYVLACGLPKRDYEVALY